MDYFGLIYLAVFSLVWLFGLREDIELKVHKYYIFLSILTGMLLIASVVLTWPAQIPAELKRIWRYVFVFMIVSELMLTQYELKILPEKIEQKSDEEFEVDIYFIFFAIILSIMLLGPGFYYAYKVAFL